jgi:hypothetical protein
MVSEGRIVFHAGPMVRFVREDNRVGEPIAAIETSATNQWILKQKRTVGACLPKTFRYVSFVFAHSGRPTFKP